MHLFARMAIPGPLLFIGLVALAYDGADAIGDPSPQGQPTSLTVLRHFRMGETDPGATPGGSTNVTYDGSEMLSTMGAVYRADIAASAATGTASSLSLETANAGSAVVVTDARNDFGIELWVKPSQSAGTRRLAYVGNAGGNGWGLVESDGAFRFIYGGISFYGSAPFTVGQWYHVALVRSGGVGTLYVDGVAAGSTPDTPNAPDDSLGFDSGVGIIDELRVFTFAPGGFVVDDLLLPSPEIAVEQPVGTSIADGHTRDFGLVALGASADITFTIRNVGTSDLTGIAATIDGADASRFAVTAAPATSVVPGASTTLTVRYTPNAEKADVAALHVASNDATEAPFDSCCAAAGPCRRSRSSSPRDPWSPMAAASASA